MSLLQTSLNKELPYGRVFQGSGDQDPKDRDVKFYQHGLYFRANGELAVNSPHNAEKIAIIESLGGINPDEPPAQIQEPDRAPINPEIVAKMGNMSDEEVQTVAERMVAALAKQNTPTPYLPQIEKRDENIRFIAKYAS